MKKSIPKIMLGVLLVGGFGYLAQVTDETTEVNAMTGAIRTKMRYAYVIHTHWKVRSTWAAESASRQGISTEKGWRYLGTVSERLLSTTHECGRAPASYPLNVISPEALNLTTTDEIDHFVRDFVPADESKRRQMISDSL